MNEALIENLRALVADKTVVVTLYERLYAATFFALVEDPTVGVDDLSFLTYPAADRTRELPVFTTGDRPLLLHFESTTNASRVEVDGPKLWRKVLEVLGSGEYEVAVDAGEAHGIRLSRTMVLGMLGAYGAPSS